MASITARKIKGKTYFYAVQSARVNGKPRLVMQKYLGSAKDIINAIEGRIKFAQPNKLQIFSFGGVAAAWAMAQKLKFIHFINKHVPKRDQGVSVGEYLTLAAINRCVSPCSKNVFGQWYKSTSLARIHPLSTASLTSQRFWDHMAKLTARKIRAIERDITSHMLNEFKLDLRTLAYDATNFFTYVSTFNEINTLAQRGKSKEHRSDLRIIGLALLVSMDSHVPLFHKTYPGNTHDSKIFASVTEELLARYRLLKKHCNDITLVFDKGNNSADNIAAIDESEYHVVGSLPYDHHLQLLKVPKKKYRKLRHPKLPGVAVYRTALEVLGVERTVLVTFNQNLYDAQYQTILMGLKKRTEKLHALQLTLRRRASGKITRGRAATKEGLAKQVDTILKGQHMKNLIQVQIQQKRNALSLTYQCNQTELQRLCNNVLGKTILFTDNSRWKDSEIILAYRGQYNIEDAFRKMKNSHFISIRPMFHWTDSMIRVHAFYCVLSLTISSLITRVLSKNKIEITAPRLFKSLNKIQEVAMFWPKKEGRPLKYPKPEPSRNSIQLSEMSPEQRKIFAALDLKELAPPVI